MTNYKDITKISTYPEELADMIAHNLHDTKNQELINDLIAAFEWIEAAAQNEYNNDYWRTLYGALDRMAYHTKNWD